MQHVKRPQWLAYLIAIGAIAVATAVSLLVLQWLPGTGLLFAIYFGAVAIAAACGGRGPGLLATVLSYLTANFFIVLPHERFVINGTVIAYLLICALIVVFSEVTRRALRRALASSQQTAAILESMPDGFVALDSRRQFTYLNPVAAELRRSLQIEGHREAEWSEFPPITGKFAEARLAEAEKDRVTVEFEQYFQPQNQWYEVKVAPNSAGGLAIYFRDVTKRKLAEDERRKLAAIVDFSEDAILSIDLEERITSWNNGARTLYGYEEQEVIGRPISLIIPPELEDQQLELLARIVREERFVHFDTERVAKGGRRIPISLSISPIKDANGRIIGASKIARDITDRKRAEELAREAERRKDNFLAVLGHELRNPLAAIVNGVQVLHYVDHLPEDVIEIRDLIRRQADQMRRLIDDLLDVSRIARGKITLRMRRFDVVPLFRQIAEDYRTRMREQQLAFLVDLPADSVWVDGDPVRLSQVLGNLLDNAIKFSDSGGRVCLRLGVDTDKGSALVTVCDEGAGLAPETRDTLFEAFAQAEETRERSRGGLGLGLALVKGLVELHEGTVEAHSDGPGKGSTFLARLPLRTAPLTGPADAPSDVQRANTCRGLIIEDNPDVSRPMSRLLELNGHQVAVACDGPSGLDVACQFAPDIVFCDIGLPGGMDGYSVARALRANEATSSAFLVAVTGFGQEEDRRRALEAGFNRHLTKPPSHADLLALLAEVSAARLQRG